MPFEPFLPSLAALGLWSYWAIGLAAFLEAFFLTGAFVPGTLIVDAGGVLVQQGVLDYLDLVWFVALGAILGGEASYALGCLGRHILSRRQRLRQSRGFRRAARLFQRFGGFALVPGRFLGPLFGVVALAAALAGLPRRRFMAWNVFSGILYALVHTGFGVLVGGIATGLGPLANRLGLVVVAVVLALALLWWLLVRLLRLLPFALSILRSIGAAIRDNPDVLHWAKHHPQLSGFLARRFDRSHFTGRTATLLGLGALYLAWVWVGTVFDLLMIDPIVQADTRLANLIRSFWSPDLLRLAAHVTALGDWRVVAALMTATGTLALMRRRPDLLAGLLVTVAGNLATVTVLKHIFDRPRPALAYFVETSGSFPSGHAAISAAFYGFAAFLLWRLHLLRAITAAFAAMAIALLIGASRLFLIEHYLSDVLNGWLVGATWLVIGVTYAEWRHSQRRAPVRGPVAPARRKIGVVAIAALTLFALWQVAAYQRAQAIGPGPTGDVTIADVAALVDAGTLAAQTESIGGTPLEPVNVIVLARDEAQFVAAMAQAGWLRARDPDANALMRAALAAWTNSADATAPVTPYFWRNAPNDLAFQKPTPEATLRQRHHVRFWRTEFVTAAGERLFVGAASFDDGLAWGLLHRIAPDIDAERDTLVDDLKAQGALRALDSLRLTVPRLGRSVVGDPWFADGKAAVLTLH